MIYRMPDCRPARLTMLVSPVRSKAYDEHRTVRTMSSTVTHDITRDRVLKNLYGLRNIRQLE